jgi:SAM-dependent methyltransferase
MERRGGWPPVGRVSFGSLRRTEPVNREFGFTRGTPVDRFFIEKFLQAHAGDISGRVLEIGDDMYTVRFGRGKVERSDILHAVAGNPAATIIGRLDTGEGLPDGAFDCVILTQTLHCIYDVHGAVRNIRRILRPGGVALVSIPGITQISRFDADRWGDYWRMTPAAVKRLFSEAFAESDLTLQENGNVLLAAAFLYGLVVEDLPGSAMEVLDPDYPLVTCVRARKAV